MAKARRKAKLVRGTTHYGKPKSAVTLPGSDWDMGPRTLAQMGNVEDMTDGFRDYVRQVSKAAMKPKKVGQAEVDGQVEDVMETEGQVLRRLAKGYLEQATFSKVIEDAKTFDEEKGQWVNPNGVKRARRVDLIESYHAQGKIDYRGMLAGLALRMAYETTMKSAPAIKKIQVDTFPKPDANIAIIIDRISRFSIVYGLVPLEDRPILDCVILQNAGPNNIGFKGSAYHKGIARLQEALTRLADALDL